MPKQKITKTFLHRVSIPRTKSKILYSDTINNGLVLEVRNNGAKTFYCRYYKENKTLYKKIGSYPEMDINDIRNKFILMNNQLNNPQNTSVLIHQNILKNKSMTLGEFFYKYYLPYIKTSKKSFREDNSFYKNHILPLWENEPMNNISRADITAAHISLVRDKKLSNSVANKLIKFLSYTYNLAISWDISGVTTNPTRFIKLLKENEHKERYLSDEEIKNMLDVASKSSNPLIKSFLEFLLLTGARKSEALSAKWEDIDLINNIFTIPLTKAGKIRRVPISNKLSLILKSMPKLDETYLFVSIKTNKPMKNIDHYWYDIRKKADINDVRLHDLRHTFASNLVNKGVSIYEVQKLLGHSNISITQRYAHLSNQSLIDAVNMI